MTTRRKAAKRKPATKKKTTKKKPASKKAARKKTAKKKPTPEKAVAVEKADSNVTSIQQYRDVSINVLSMVTGHTRRTCTKRLKDAGVKASGTVRGHPVYPWKESLEAVYLYSSGMTDPDKLPPFERRAFYQGEKEKLGLAQERGELVVAIEMERDVGSAFKMVTRHLDTIPDILERDHGVTGHILVTIEQVIDVIREDLYNRINKLDEDADSTISASE